MLTASTRLRRRTAVSSGLLCVRQGDRIAAAANLWGSKLQLGHLLADFTNALPSGGGRWVHAVAFSPDGDREAWVGHDSIVNVARAGKSPAQPSVMLRTDYLPFLSLVWLTRARSSPPDTPACPFCTQVSKRSPL